ncbi:MAG: hypothetical protein AB7P01_14610 [Bacteroidia bacterium]
MKPFHFILALSTSLIFTSCTKEFDREEAKKLFEQSPNIPHALVGDFPLYQSMYKPKEYLEACKKHGLLKLTSANDNYRVGADQYWNFTLTDVGKPFFVKEGNRMSGKVALLTVCSLKVKEVTGIKFLNEGKTKACIEYKLMFSDITKAGDMFNDFAFTFYGRRNDALRIDTAKEIQFTTTAEKYDDGWRLYIKKTQGDEQETYRHWQHLKFDYCGNN